MISQFNISDWIAYMPLGLKVGIMTALVLLAGLAVKRAVTR